jgi:hypothetical protein
MRPLNTRVTRFLMMDHAFLKWMQAVGVRALFLPPSLGPDSNLHADRSEMES